ncbi:unnamed protein product, partial [Nesidiocoris tenuis]
MEMRKRRRKSEVASSAFWKIGPTTRRRRGLEAWWRHHERSEVLQTSSSITKVKSATHESISDDIEGHRTVSDNIGRYRTIMGGIGQYWTYRTILDGVGPYWTVSDNIGLYRTILDSIGQYWKNASEVSEQGAPSVLSVFQVQPVRAIDRIGNASKVNREKKSTNVKEVRRKSGKGQRGERKKKQKITLEKLDGDNSMEQLGHNPVKKHIVWRSFWSIPKFSKWFEKRGLEPVQVLIQFVTCRRWQEAGPQLPMGEDCSGTEMKNKMRRIDRNGGTAKRRRGRTIDPKEPQRRFFGENESITVSRMGCKKVSGVSRPS